MAGRTEHPHTHTDTHKHTHTHTDTDTDTDTHTHTQPHTQYIIHSMFAQGRRTGKEESKETQKGPGTNQC